MIYKWDYETLRLLRLKKRMPDRSSHKHRIRCFKIF